MNKIISTILLSMVIAGCMGTGASSSSNNQGNTSSSATIPTSSSVPISSSSVSRSSDIPPVVSSSSVAVSSSVALSSSSVESSSSAVGVMPQCIINGTSVSAGTYPWMVKINGCTASLISPHFVLTAAHCFGYSVQRNEEGTLEGVEIQSASVRFGDPDLDSANIERRDVKQVYIHPEYLKLTRDEVFGKEPYDHALLELEEPIFLDKYLVLPNRQPIEGEEVIVAGWGATETGGQSRILREITREVRARATCHSGDEGRFCTGPSDEADPDSNIGSGDSGGPVFVPQGDGHMLLGVNSTAGGVRATHASSFAFLPWILEVAGEDIDDECPEGMDVCNCLLWSW